MALYDFTIYSIIERNAKLLPEHTALIWEDQSITHKAFKERVNRLASGLLEGGIKKGDRLGVLAQNSIEYFTLYGAAAQIGAVMVPINWRFSPKEIGYILADTTPRFIFADPEFHPAINDLAPNLNFIEAYFSMFEGRGKFQPFEFLMKRNETRDKIQIASDDSFVIIYTAAVTGKPRGAVLSHGNLITANTEYLMFMDIQERDVHLAFLPLYHIACLGMAMAVLHAGGKNIIMSKFDKNTALENIEKEGVTLFANFPPILSNLLEEAEVSSRDLSSLRWVMGIEQPDIIEKLEKATNSRFVLGYGQTEVSGVVSLGVFSEKPGSAGKPGLLIEMKLVDEYDREVDIGKVGEIAVRGPGVFKGYWQLEEETKYTFRNEWHHTGDLGRFDHEGYLWYEGRTPEKELIKPGGENVYPAEVEAIILEHPSIKEVCIIGVPDSEWGEAIKAVCVLKSGQSVADKDLIEFVGARISRYKKPKFVDFVQDLPKASGGAIDREKIKTDFGAA
ncbi:MAG: AMP-binding protein [Thermodesulfobacteriota bacterium]|nr:AMP-binding protein [Thermodesulfobacteriota bacterium]